MSAVTSRRLSCSIHGLALRLKCSVPALHDAIEHALEPFLVSEWPEGFVPIDGTMHPYATDEVMQHLPATARRFSSSDAAMELYVDAQRFWLVDDRWGMAEIDLTANTFRSWILPTPTIDAQEIAELAMLWPAAQLLRGKGLYLLPAVSIAKDDWGMLLIGSTGVEPEITALVEQGYYVVGQRWTALREEDGGVAMLHMPGQIARGTTRRIKPRGASLMQPSSWIDVAAQTPGASKNHAFCHAVAIMESGRRPDGWVRPVPPIQALEALRSNWPMIELQPSPQSSGRIADRLAMVCAIVEIRLSRNPMEIIDQIESIRATGSPLLAETQLMLDAMPPVNLTPWSLAG